MFRISSSLVTSRCFVFRRPRLEIQLLPISSCPPSLKYKKPGDKERDPCPIPPPLPPPPPKDDSMFWGAMGVLFLSGAFVAFAKNNPEVRDWLSIRAPWVDDFIAILYQENMTYKEYLEECGSSVKESLKRFKLENFDKSQIEGSPLHTSIDSATEDVPDYQDNEGDYVKNLNTDEKAVQEKDKSAESCEDIVPPPILTKNICDIENCMQDLGESAICCYTKARAVCTCYNKMVESTMVKFSVPAMKKLQGAMEERISQVNENVEKAVAATTKLDELSRYFDCGVTASKEAIQNTKDLLVQFKDRIRTMQIQWEWENDMALARDIQWQKVDEFMNKYIDENKTMTKDLDYDSPKPQLKGDPDLLLHHTLRYVEMLNEQLTEVLVAMQERVNRGVETLPQDEASVKAANKEITAIFKKKLGELDAEFVQRFKDKKAENEQFLRDSLKKQLEQAQVTLEIRLKQREVEAEKKLTKLVAEQVDIERKEIKKELGKMATKLKIVEDKLKARLEAEQETRRSQELWAAGASLLAATKKGDPLVKVDRELKAIEKASGDGDKLVLTVLKAIPDSVRQMGVVPESALRERYRTMEDVALKVALVEQEGGILPIYVLSFVQSIFLFMKISGIPQDEFEKPPKEPSKDLDTFDLLQRARFWMERGNIAAALKYVTALEGASRAAAAAWHDAARSHLETRQAAEAVLAHAAAMGLQYI